MALDRRDKMTVKVFLLNLYRNISSKTKKFLIIDIELCYFVCLILEIVVNFTFYFVPFWEVF